MRIRCAGCGQPVEVADTGVLPQTCPHCRCRPVPGSLGRFTVVRLLAAGGMGEVYLAEHEELGTRVALKLLPTPAGVDGAAVRERFRREARLTASIDHPGVVRVLDLVEDAGRMFLVLELVEGRSLRSRLREGPLSAPDAVAIATAAADVLGAAHARGVVHRDIKPENVMLCPDGRVRVLDFGIARALQDQEPLTRTGELLGTPEYMAPEQLLEVSGAVDARADVHALGVLTYELLTGRSPFAGASLFAALKLVESLVPPPPSRLAPGVAPAVDEVVLRALAKDPAARHPDGAAFATALRSTGVATPTADAAAASRGRSIWRSSVVVAASSGVAGLVLGAVFGVRPPVAATTPPVAVALAAPPMAAETALARGRALLRDGAVAAALVQLEQAVTDGEPGARGVAAVAWHAEFTLLPWACGAPAWFALADRPRRERLFAAVADDASAIDGRDPLWDAARALLEGDAAAAWRIVDAVPEAQRSHEHVLIGLLAARFACADPARFDALARRIAPEPRPPLLELVASPAARTEACLRSLASAAAVDGPDRWLWEFAAASAEALRTGRPPSRLRSAAELGWLTGAGAAMPYWTVAVRMLAAQRGEPPVAAELARMASLFADDWPDERPAADVARAWLQLPVDPAASQQILRSADLPAWPSLALLRAWAHADAAELPALAAALQGEGGGATSPIPRADTPARTIVHAVVALAEPGRSEAATSCRRERWTLAMAHPAALESLAGLPMSRRAVLDELRALLLEHADAAQRPPGFVAALRLWMRLADDPEALGPLRVRFAKELADGIG